MAEKPLFPICGKPLLTHIVDRLAQAGCSDIVFVGSANNLQEVRTLYPDAHVVEQENLDQGMRGALLSALPQTGDEDILVVGANDVIDPAGYKATVAAGKAKGRSGALLGQTVNRYFPGGYLSVQDDRITGIVEKPGEGNEPSNMVNIVCHYHRDGAVLLAALRTIDEKNDDGYGYEKALDELFRTESYAAVPYDGVWQAVKYPWHLLSLLPVLLSEIPKQRIHKTASVHETAVITGPVVLEDGVKVFPHATIVGPCFIGKGSIVANNALVRQSSVGEHCVIGYNTEVKGSVLHSHVWTHMSYIGDSVIGRNVSFGGGSMTGNLRLDEGTVPSMVEGQKVDSGLTKLGAIIGDDCRLGVRTTINPGMKIGVGTFISSGALIEEDIPDCQFARMRCGVLQLSENKTGAPQPEQREEFRRKAGL